MSDKKRLENTLKDLLRVLRLEKEVLMENNAAALQPLVETKKALLEKLQGFAFEGLPEDRALKDLMEEVDRFQETNLLLTRQALSYQEKLLHALSKSNTSKFNTYSAKGSVSGDKEVRIVDQSG